MRNLLLPALMAFLLVGYSPPPKRYIPPPLRVFIPFESAWDGMHEALKSKELQVELEHRGKGYIISTFNEYMSGPLTTRYLGKIGDSQRISDGDFVKARYQYEVLIEFVEEKQVLITVNANIQALKRDFLGQQEWVDIPTLGHLEEDLLTIFGTGLFGDRFRLNEPEVGFWERDPTYLPDLSQKIPKIARPERP